MPNHIDKAIASFKAVIANPRASTKHKARAKKALAALRPSSREVERRIAALEPSRGTRAAADDDDRDTSPEGLVRDAIATLKTAIGSGDGSKDLREKVREAIKLLESIDNDDAQDDSEDEDAIARSSRSSARTSVRLARRDQQDPRAAAAMDRAMGLTGDATGVKREGVKLFLGATVPPTSSRKHGA